MALRITSVLPLMQMLTVPHDVLASIRKRRAVAVLGVCKKPRKERVARVPRERMDFEARTQDLSDDEFKRMFRVDRTLFAYLLDELGDTLKTEHPEMALRSSRAPISCLLYTSPSPRDRG